MPETTVAKSPFVDRVPGLENSKWGGMGIAESQAVVRDILSGGPPAVRGLIDGLQEVDNGSDWKERLLLHMLVTQCSVPERKGERAMLVETYIAAAREERPATVQSFLLQQLRYIADGTAVAKLAPFLKEKDVLVLDAVTMTMVSIGTDAEPVLREAMEGAEGHAKDAIEHALNQIG